MSCGDIFLGLIAILFPPIAGKSQRTQRHHTRRFSEHLLTVFPVWIKSGLCSADSLINILLCMLGYVPGLIHAWYIIAKNPEYDYEAIPDAEGAPHGRGGQRVTYYYVSHENRPRGNNTGYGTQGQGQGQGRAPAVPQNSRPTVSGPSSGENANAAPPPSYADAVKGDHKVQSQE